MADLRGLLDDLATEQATLDRLVAGLDEAAWRTATPADGWDVRDSIAHLAASEELASLALVDAAAFDRRLQELLDNVEATTTALVESGRVMTGADVLGWWRATRTVTADALREHASRDRIPWIAGPMSTMSFASARLMETWAHGTDVRDGLGVETTATPRLRHVADLGVRTRPFAYAARRQPLPDGDVRVELEAPDGATWSWGASTTDVVRGPAVDFCRVVTQRANPADTRLEVEGDTARGWIEIAQAFAGPPTEQRAPRSA